jgi:hypothetical protein
MPKQTYASVTEKPCTCKYLQNSADDPDNPIEFDVRTAEFHFVYDDSMLVIYHCPFCGGAAPESKRATLFTQIPRAEQERLQELLRGIRTMDDAIRKFGEPALENVSVSKFQEREDIAPRIEPERTIRYEHLSDVADVCIAERPDGQIYWCLLGKFIGRDTESSRRADTPTLKRRWWQFWR